MEADLRRFYPGSEPAALGLVRTAWLIRHLPSEAVLSGNDGWSISAFLQADTYASWSGQPHPADPRLKRAAEARADQLTAARAKSDERRRRLGITGSVLRKGA